MPSGGIPFHEYLNGPPGSIPALSLCRQVSQAPASRASGDASSPGFVVHDREAAYRQQYLYGGMWVSSLTETVAGSPFRQNLCRMNSVELLATADFCLISSREVSWCLDLRALRRYSGRVDYGGRVGSITRPISSRPHRPPGPGDAHGCCFGSGTFICLQPGANPPEFRPSQKPAGGRSPPREGYPSSQNYCRSYGRYKSKDIRYFLNQTRIIR